MLALQVKVKAKLDLGTEKEKQYVKRHIKLLLPFVDQKRVER